MGLLSGMGSAFAPVLVAGLVALVGGRWIERPVALAGVSLLGIPVLAGLAAVGVVEVSEALTGAVALTLVASLAAIYLIDRPGGQWGRRLRSRFVMGVPWGTLVVSAFVVSVYLFVQGGLSHWSSPVTLAFRAWSFLYPLGILTAGFAHSGSGHLVGNLMGTLVLGTLAEYAWGHFPTARGQSSFGSWRTNPWVRALVVFPGMVVLVALLTAIFAIGPVIGFSGVVFAFMGFALTRYPIRTVVGLAAAGAVRTGYAALQNPVVTTTAQPSPPSAPWWAGIAIQGHALGLFLGIVLGWYVFTRRKETPSALALWVGVLLVGMEQALWAVYWFRGSDTYVLYRGPGIVLVAALGLLVAASLTASDRRLLPSVRGWGILGGGVATPDADERSDADSSLLPGVDRGRTSGRGQVPGGDHGPAPVRESKSDGSRSFTDWLSRRTGAFLVLVIALAVIAGPGFGSNLLMVSGGSSPGEGVEVADYRVAYAEGVSDGMVGIVDVSMFDESTDVETSGVIVTSERRHIWQRVVSKTHLAFSGQSTVVVGGPGWRKTVIASRQGWSAVGNDTAYKVWLRPPDENRELVYRSDPTTAEPVVDDRNVTVTPTEDGFELAVTRANETLGTTPVPDPGNATTAGGLELENEEGTIYAVREGTRVPIVEREEYE